MGRPRTFKSRRNRVVACTGIVRIPRTVARLFARTLFGSTVAFSNRMSTSNQSDILSIVHAHASKDVTNGVGGTLRIRTTMYLGGTTAASLEAVARELVALHAATTRAARAPADPLQQAAARQIHADARRFQERTDR